MDMDYFAWCKSHGFFKPLCPTHKATNLKEEQGRWVCMHPFEDGTYCRKVANTMAPTVNPYHLFIAVHTLANGLSLGKS